MTQHDYADVLERAAKLAAHEADLRAMRSQGVPWPRDAELDARRLAHIAEVQRDAAHLRALAKALREAKPELDAGEGLDGFFIRLPKEAP